jgi:hypothetical protein
MVPNQENRDGIVNHLQIEGLVAFLTHEFQRGTSRLQATQCLLLAPANASSIPGGIIGGCGGVRKRSR